jgi:hypothetical protein
MEQREGGMRGHRRWGILPALVTCFGLTGPAMALTVPDCGALRSWGAAHDPRADWPVNRELSLPDILAAPVTSPLFGEPAIDWTRNELRELGSRLAGCRRLAAAAGDRDGAAAFAEIADVLRPAARIIIGIAGARATVAQRLPALLEMELDPPTVAALDALAGADEEGLHEIALGESMGPAASEVQRISHSLSVLPTAEIAAIRAQARERAEQGRR